MADTTITIRIDSELKKSFSRIAEAHNRSVDELLCEFIRNYIETQRTDSEYEQWFRRQVQIGIDDADAGDFAPEGKSEFAALHAIPLKNLPESAQ